MDERILFEKLDKISDTVSRLDERSERAEKDRDEMKAEIGVLKTKVDGIVVDRKLSKVKTAALLGLVGVGGGAGGSGLASVLKAWLGVGGGQ
jgi:hypothetical protein